MKLKNVLMISFLAIAGIFGASSAIVNNEVKETPVVEKAEAKNAPSGTDKVGIYFKGGYSNTRIWMWNGQYNYTGDNWDSRPYLYVDTYGSRYEISDVSGHPTYFKLNDNSNRDFDYTKPFYLSETSVISNNNTLLYIYCSRAAENNKAFSFDAASLTFTLSTGILEYEDELKFYGKNYRTDYQADDKGNISGLSYNSTTTNYKVDARGVFTFKCTAAAYGTYGTISYGMTESTFTNVSNVTLDMQSGSGGTSSVNAYKGSNMPSATMPTRTGYTFGGYYTGKNGTGTQYYTSSGASARNWDKTDNTITLYAKWTAHTYTIAFNKNADGATGSTASVTGVTYNATGKSLTSNGFTYDGHRFKGWSTTTSGSVEYSNGKSLTVADTIALYPGSSGGTKTLYAVWEEITTYTVTLAVSPSGYGHFEYGGSTVTSITVPENTTYTSSGNVLTFTDVGSVTAVPKDLDGYDYSFSSFSSSSGTITDNTTITATFERSAHSYSVTLNKNGGTINSGNITSYTYGVGATLPTDVTKHGYNFGGWYANSSLTGDRQSTISTTATGNKSYWAKWSEYNDFWVSFDGGTTKTALNKVSTESAPSDCLYQLNTQDTLTVWASQTISFYRGATAQTATIVSSSNIEADSAGDILSITPSDNKWQINNYATGQTLYFKIRKSGQSSPYSFYLGGKQDRSSTTCGVTSGTTFYIQDLIKKNGANTNYSADGAKLAVYFYNAVGEGVNVTAWSTTFATRIKTDTPTGVDLYSITVPQFNGTNMTWGSVIVCRFDSSAKTSDISFDSDKRFANNGAKLTSFNSGVENMIQITAWSGSGVSEYPSPCNSTMYTDGGLKSGTGVYVDISGLNYGAWTIDNTRHLYIYFFSVVDGDGDAHVWSSALTAIPGKANFYECQVPQYNSKNVEWAKLIVVNNTTPAFVEGLNHYQTQDMWYSSAIRDHQLITFTGSQTSEAKVEASNNNNYQDTDRAETWGKNFYTTNVVCDGKGSITTDNWTTSKNDYNAAASSVKTLITNATASESDYLGKAVDKYDYIVHKYGTGAHEDYASRISGGHFTYGSIGNFSPYSLIMNSEDDTATIIIIIAASVSLLSITALSILLVKKRKRVDN